MNQPPCHAVVVWMESLTGAPSARPVPFWDRAIPEEGSTTTLSTVPGAVATGGGPER
jgi:hypothetical protein